MNYTLVKDRIALVAMMAILFPFVSFAQTSNQVCSPIGYTIATINGVFTDEPGARKNRDNLKALLDRTYNNEPLTVDFLFNPSHASGAGDVLKAIQQGLFSDEDIRDTDLLSMLASASKQVNTQKLLLVPHSQGNFYANAIRKNLADQPGGVPAKSIGIFGVASPASHIYDGGTWLTSTTDKVIAGLVGKYSPKGILTPNTTINFRDSDGDLNGHDFTKIYLKYKTPEIINGIQSQLSKLQADPNRREDIPCIDPPKITLLDRIDASTLAVLDNPQNPMDVPAVLIANLQIKAVVAVANAGIFVVKTGAGVVVWTYQAWMAFATTAYLTAVSLSNDNTGTGLSNTASVILATQSAQSAPVSVASNNIEGSQTSFNTTTAPVVVNVSTDPSQASIGAPRLVFIGNLSPGFGESENNSGGGWSSWTQVSGVNVVAKQAVPAKSKGAALAAPSLFAHQCAFSLATSGCLLATTTLRFEWTSATTTAYYSINKNGILATTTEHSFETNARDFSDYIFEIASVDNMGTTSATSTKKISVATIPIAINEIAWMGTVANDSDEWIELKNNTGHTLALSQWVLEARGSKDEKPVIELAGFIKPYEYIIFERTDNTAVKDVLMHAKYTGDLHDSGDQLTLSYVTTTLGVTATTTFDQTPVGAWVAGATSTRKTMERRSSKTSGTDIANWGTNNGINKNGSDAAGNPINGTPGAENSTTLSPAPITTPPPALVVEAPGILSPSDLNKNGIPDADEAEVVVDSNIFLPAGEYKFNNLTIASSSTLTLEGDPSSTNVFKGVKIFATNLTITNGSSISADSKGYSIGPGAPSADLYYAGASYGGVGSSNTATSIYGSATTPTDLGSGANGHNSRGGGAIRIVVTDTLANDGIISADGGTSSSGGSIYVTTNNLTGAGIFRANGGWRNVSGYYQGPGGGGRIAIYFQESSFAGEALSSGGWSGTVGFFDTTTNNLIINSSWRFQKNDGPFNFNRVIITDGAQVSVEDGVNITARSLLIDKGSSFALSGNQSLAIPAVIIDGGSTLTLSGSETLSINTLSVTGTSTITVAIEHTLSLTVQNLTITSGSSISADGKGYAIGPGAPAEVTYSTPGAIYGGVSSLNTTASTYGSATAPTDLGSGANGHNSRGGGAIRIVVTDTLANDGIISADGGTSSSGGSIYVTTNNLAGTGIFRANGGGFWGIGLSTMARWRRSYCYLFSRVFVCRRSVLFWWRMYWMYWRSSRERDSWVF